MKILECDINNRGYFPTVDTEVEGWCDRSEAEIGFCGSCQKAVTVLKVVVKNHAQRGVPADLNPNSTTEMHLNIVPKTPESHTDYFIKAGRFTENG